MCYILNVFFVLLFTGDAQQQKALRFAAQNDKLQEETQVMKGLITLF